MSEKWKVWIVVDSERFMSIIEACQRSPQPDHSRNFLDDRYFLSDADVVRTSGNAYVLSTQWAASATGKTLNEVIPCLERVFAPEGLKIRIA